MLTQARLGDSLMKSMMKKKQEKGGELSLEDIGEIFEQVAEDFQFLHGETESLLKNEILKMANYIDQVKEEIASLSDDDSKPSEAISGATIHLDAVVKSTENATNEIMDAADKIQEAAAGIGGEAEQKIMDASMKIYEACNFQDLTGQQINKVLKMIEFVEERLDNLTKLFAHGGVNKDVLKFQGKDVKDINVEDIDDKDLMNGPQLEQPSQDDIDALFDSIDVKSNEA